MGLPFNSVGQGNIFSLKQARAFKTALTEPVGPTFPSVCASTQGPSFVAPPSRALAPWRIVPAFDDRAAIFDAENQFVMIERSDLVHRIVEAINEVEGRIAHG